MALGARYDGLTSKMLRHGFAMHEIEGNPTSDKELDQYRRMQAKGWSDARQSKFVIWKVKREFRQH